MATYTNLTPIGPTPFERSKTSPNNTTNVDCVSASSSSLNVDLALRPKGVGALQAAIPDNTAAGGNRRGQYAVDWQMVRSAATQVASGTTYATIGGGAYNTASGDTSTVGGGSNNIASGYLSVIPGGNWALAELQGKLAHASGTFGNYGDAQFGRIILRGATTTNTSALVLTANASTASATNTLVLGNNKVYSYKIELVANSAVVGSGAVYGTSGGNWSLSGLIRRTADAASTALIGIPAVTAANIDSAISACTVALTADTTLGGLQIAVTGVANTNIHWVAVVTTTEVG